MRRAGYFATLAAGVALLGASLHGMTGVDETLRIAAAPTPHPELVRESQVHDRDCGREREREKRHPRV